MIKREPGYDPRFGDWEYFYYEGGQLESGRLVNCRNCHNGAAARDHVFGGWDQRSEAVP